jgi:hypothetical protein
MTHKPKKSQNYFFFAAKRFACRSMPKFSTPFSEIKMGSILQKINGIGFKIIDHPA